MFKEVYRIEKWNGIRTHHHKKYKVFDGLGILFFDTLSQARSYVRIKSLHLKSVYKQSKEFFKLLTDYYFDRLIRFRIFESDNQLVNTLLSDCLDMYKFLSKPRFSQYILGKLKTIYSFYLTISKVLKLSFLQARIEKVCSAFFVEYPRYYSNNQNVNKIELSNLKPYERCII